MGAWNPPARRIRPTQAQPAAAGRGADVQFPTRDLKASERLSMTTDAYIYTTLRTPRWQGARDLAHFTTCPPSTCWPIR